MSVTVSVFVRHRLYISLFILPLLAITSQAGKLYKGAEYRTKSAYLYGKFEVRMKAMSREGTLASFFTYNDNFPSTPWNEIDIEILGRYTDDVQFNTITPGQVNHASHQYVNFNPALEYHVYGFEWTPEYVAWFIDSVEVYRQTGSHIASLNQQQKIMMNVWNPTAEGWAGKWNDAVLPTFAYYDWVSYSSYTPQSGSKGTGNNFSPQWIDNFDSWDQTRWDKASHTWDGNNCDFLYENAVFRDGKLILCLTKESSVGYVDNVPPSVLWGRLEGTSIKLFFSEELDKASAETTTNYVLSNSNVTTAQLQPDQRTVVISVDSLSSSNVIVQNITDTWSVPNEMTPKNVVFIKPTPLTFPIKINAGGAAYSGYLADQPWSQTTEYGRLDGQTSYFSDVSIAGTTDPEIFRSELFDVCEYKIRVPNGRHMVSLMMAENYFSSANQRKMTIVVEGKQIETGLDLFEHVGFRAAYQKATFIDVADGVIDIHMQGLIDRPLLNGISVTSLSTDVNEIPNVDSAPRSYEVFPNYPNPFNGGTTITFSIPRNDFLILKVYDILGRKVSEKKLGEFHKGVSHVFWDAHNDATTTLSSGIYFYCIEGSVRSTMQKLLYLK
jgi:hypothetical protein